MAKEFKATITVSKDDIQYEFEMVRCKICTQLLVM